MSELRFGELLAELRTWFRYFDSRYLLCTYAFNNILMQRAKANEPTMPGDNHDFSAEILQAIALTHGGAHGPQFLGEHKHGLMRNINSMTYLLLFRDLGIKGRQKTKKDNDSIVSAVRSNTSFVRNWSYRCHAKEVITDLLGDLNPEFKKEHGITGHDIAKFFVKVDEIVLDKLETHLRKFDAMRRRATPQSMTSFFAEEYPEVYGSNSEFREKISGYQGFFKFARLRSLLELLTDIALPERFSFSIEEMSESLRDNNPKTLRAFIDMLSYEFGALEIRDVDSLILDNPVRKKPFIRLENDTYLCPLISSFWDYVPHIIEESILPSCDERMRNKYSRVKSTYTERYVADLFSKYFPRGQSFENVTWSRSDRPKEKFETDNLMILGPCVLIAECKSHGLTAPARRGGPSRLARDVEDFVLNPSRQNNNFIEAVTKGLLVSVKAKNGKDVAGDLRQLKHYIPIAANLDFSGNTWDSKMISESGFSKGMKLEEISLCLRITDLKSVFEVLPYMSMRLHYLMKRKELESNVILSGIETDFLEFYLHSGFNMEKKPSGKYMLALGDARKVDAYFMTRGTEYQAPLPGPRMTELWCALLEILDKRIARKGYLDAAFALLDCSFMEQKTFENKVKFFLKKPRFLRLHRWHMVHSIEHRGRKTILSAFICDDRLSKEKGVASLRKKMARNHMSVNNTRLILCVEKMPHGRSYDLLLG